MNQYEWGVLFYMALSFDLSGYTGLMLTFTKPDGTVMTRTNPQVVMGTTEITTTLGTLAPNTWVSYTFANGEVDQSGVWSVRLTYNDASRQLISDPATFTLAA